MASVRQPFRDALHQAVKSGKLDVSGWDALKARAAEEAKEPGPAARALAEVWVNPAIQMPYAVEDDVAWRLQWAGYQALPGQRPRTSGTAQLAQLLRSNVNEIDVEFLRLSRAVHRRHETITIAVIDGGFQTSHPALAAKWWTSPTELAGNAADDNGDGRIDEVHGWNYARNSADLTGSAHGNHVGGIATAGTRRIHAIASVATYDALPTAIDDAARDGARVINLSLAVVQNVDAVADAVARNADVLFSLAAGNGGSDLRKPPYTPQTSLAARELPNLAVVGAVDANGAFSAGSFFGAPLVTHAARGTRFSAYSGRSFALQTGTSMAAPAITEAAAKALLLAPHLTPPMLKALLAATSTPTPGFADKAAAGGPIDKDRALRVAALATLLRAGDTAQAAAAALRLSAADAAALVPVAQQFV